MIGFQELTRKQIYILSAALSAVLLITMVATFRSCRPHTYPAELVAADSLCDSNADSAAVLISKISADELTDADRWYLRLLKVKQKVKCNEPFSNADEADALVEHYSGSGDVELLPQTLYCTGCVYDALEDMPQATDFFFKAVEQLEQRGPSRLLSLCYYQLGYNLSFQDLHKQALHWQQKSLSSNLEAKRFKRCIYDYIDIAWTYGSLGDVRKSLACMQEARKLAAVHSPEDLSEIDCQTAVHYMALPSLSQAKRHIDKALKAGCGNYNSSQLYSTALEVYSALGIDSKALGYCDSVLSVGNIHGKKYASWWLSKYYAESGNSKAAAYYIVSCKQYSDSIDRITASEALAKANAMYNYKQREKKNRMLEEDNIRKTLYVSVSLLSLVIVSLIFVILYARTRHKKEVFEKRCRILDELLKRQKATNAASIKEKEDEIKRIAQELVEVKEQDAQKKSELEGILKEKELELMGINIDANQRTYCDLRFKQSLVYKKISEYLKGSSCSFCEWDLLKETIEKNYPGFERRFANFENMNETEFKVCLLFRAGLGATEISSFVCKSRSSVYSICWRLYEKNFGKAAAPSEWEKLIKSIY